MTIPGGCLGFLTPAFGTRIVEGEITIDYAKSQKVTFPM